jgi:Domain of unknown function (DUF4158)
MAKQLGGEPTAISDYDWQGQTGKRYRGRLRTALSIRPATADDFKAVETWLREHAVPWDHHLRHLQDAVLEWYRRRRLESPTAGRIERLVRSTVRTHQTTSQFPFRWCGMKPTVSGKSELDGPQKPPNARREALNA